METIRFTDSASDLQQAAALLRQGQVVGIPTETVYGLAADAKNPAAVRQIFAAKGRPADNPLIVHIADESALYTVASQVPPLALRLAKQFWPGPLTMVLPRSGDIPHVTSGGLDTVGIRMPAHPVAQALIRLSGVPIAAPSANRSGYPSPTTAQHVMDDMAGRIAAVVDGGSCTVGVESTVIALEGDNTVRILRPGCVTPEQLSSVAARVLLDPAILHDLQAGQTAPSPGMKYQHYAPRAKVTLIEGGWTAFAAAAAQYAAAEDGVYALVFDASDKTLPVPAFSYGTTGSQQAQQIFFRLRQMDDMGASHILVQAPERDGIGLAVYNRLLRAAGFEVIQV